MYRRVHLLINWIFGLHVKKPKKIKLLRFTHDNLGNMKKNLFCVVLGICYIDFCIHSVWIDIVLNKETRNTKVWFSIPSVQFSESD